MSNSDVFSAVRTMATDLINKANQIADEIQKSRVNVGKVVHEIRDIAETEDAKVLKYRENMKKANEQIEKWTQEVEAHIKANLVSASQMDDATYEAKKAEYASLKKSAQDAQKLAANLPGYSEAVFANLPALVTLSGGTSTGTGTGPKRPRLASLTIDGEEVFTLKENDKGEKVKSYTFTAAAQKLSTKENKVLPSDLSNAAFEAAGTDDLSTVSVVEFNYSVNGTDHTIVAYPQQASV